VKVLKLFCEMNDLPLPWKKLTRGLPKAKNYADDRVPTIEEIRKIMSYPDWRIKAIVFTVASSGIRLGAWDHLKWAHIIPINRDGQLVAAKIIVYAGDLERYFSFISVEAYLELKNQHSLMFLVEHDFFMLQVLLHVGNQQQDGGRTRDERANRRAPDYAAERRKYQPRERYVVETVVRPDCAGTQIHPSYYCSHLELLFLEFLYSYPFCKSETRKAETCNHL
jgi:hypothetical protein